MNNNLPTKSASTNDSRSQYTHFYSDAGLSFTKHAVLGVKPLGKNSVTLIAGVVRDLENALEVVASPVGTLVSMNSSSEPPRLSFCQGAIINEACPFLQEANLSIGLNLVVYPYKHVPRLGGHIELDLGICKINVTPTLQ